MFLGSDFITITKSEALAWAVLKPDVFAAIMDHYASGEPIISDQASLAASDTAIHEDDDEVRGCAVGVEMLWCCMWRCCGAGASNDQEHRAVR